MSNINDEILQNKNDSLQMLSAPLCGVVTNSTSNDNFTDNKFNRYAGSLRTSTPFQGLLETANHFIMYEVGCASDGGTVEHLLTSGLTPSSAMHAVHQPITTLRSVSAELVGLHKKYSNFSGSYKTMDMAAMLYHLSKAVAIYSSCGRLSLSALLGGAKSRIVVLNNVPKPTSADDKGVYIPRGVDDDLQYGTFLALASAANAYGSTVYTDFLCVDGNGDLHLPPINDGQLALGCYQGMLRLLCFYDRCGYGDVAALAITKGFHSIRTVVGHSDEGGIVRQVLRKKDYVAPYGGIMASGEDTYVGLPALGNSDREGFSKIVDGVCLYTAALVADCDPTANISGRIYPTTITSSLHYDNASSKDTVIPELCGEMGSKLIDASSKFCRLYTTALAKCFLVSNSTGTSCSMMMSQFLEYGSAGYKDRHLNMLVINPFFWIEPTTLLRQPSGSAADKAGLSSLCYPGIPQAMDLFEGVEVVDERFGKALLNVKFSMARRSGFLIHCSMNRLNGQSNLMPIQCDPAKFMNVGGDVPMDRAIDLDRNLGELLWTRGQSSLPTPGELVHSGELVGMVCTFQLEKDGYIVDTHVPSLNEITQKGTVFLECSAVSFLSQDKMGGESRSQKRVRSQAARAIAEASRLARAGRALLSDWTKSKVEPKVSTSFSSVPAIQKGAVSLAMEEYDKPVALAGAVERIIGAVRSAYVSTSKNPVQSLDINITPAEPGKQGPKPSVASASGTSKTEVVTGGTK